MFLVYQISGIHSAVMICHMYRILKLMLNWHITIYHLVRVVFAICICWRWIKLTSILVWPFILSLF